MDRKWQSHLPSNKRLRSIACPFCDHEIRSRDNVIRCRNCGECFEIEPDEEEFLFGQGDS